jgi:glycosyltransferase involved in cell wall biosynthesis
VLSGFPNVMTIHGNMRVMAELARSRPFSFHWLAARLEAFSLRRTAGVFCNSRYTEELVRPLNPVTWRVPNALRSAVFAPKAAPPPAIPPTRLINVGVISPRKRQLELLEVFRRLWERGYAAEIEFVGLVDSSAYGVEFLRAIRQPGVEAFARHLEFQEMPQLLAAFDRAHGSVHFPSEEAFGLVVGEALARNLKFFGARVGGVVEIAEAVEGAELIAVDDWAGLEQRLADWVEQGSARPHEAAPVMRERYHPDVVARRHMEIYREVLAGRAG